MRIHIYFFCLYTSFLVASDYDWTTYEGGLIFKRAIEVSQNRLTHDDLCRFSSINSSALKIVQPFFQTRSEKKDLFNAKFALPPHTIWAIATDNEIKNDLVNNDGKVECKSSYETLFRFGSSRKACIVPHSFFLDAFGCFVYAVEVTQDENKKLSLSRVQFPILPDGSIVYVDKKQVEDEVFSTHTQSFNMHDQNKIMCRAGKDQKRLFMLFVDTDLKDDKKSTMHLFIMEPLKASYHYAHDVGGYPDFQYVSQEDLFDDKGTLAYVSNRCKPTYLYFYHFDKNKKAIGHKEQFFTLEKPKNTEGFAKQSLECLTRGLITHVLKWPAFDMQDKSITYFYDEQHSSIPKELIEIYLKDLCYKHADIYEKIEKNDDMGKARMAQATILLGALDYPKQVYFDSQSVLYFLKKISAMSHSENGILYNDFNGDVYYKEDITDEKCDLKTIQQYSTQPLNVDAENIIDAWVLALDQHNKEENKIKWLAQHTKEAMAMEPECFLALCKNVALRYAKKSWDNGKIAVAWHKPRYSDNQRTDFQLYNLDAQYVSTSYYYSDSVDENDTVINVVYKSSRDVEFHFKKGGKYRCINGQQLLVRCDD